jgi:hypothetical protein
MCADSLRKLCIAINDDALSGGAVIYIGSFKSLVDLAIYSIANWSLTTETLHPPNVTKLTWFMYRDRGSISDLAFLLRSQFGPLNNVVLWSDNPEMRAGTQPGLISRFLDQYQQIQSFHISLAPLHWQETTRTTAVILMSIYDSLLLPEVITSPPPALRRLQVCIDTANCEHL